MALVWKGVRGAFRQRRNYQLPLYRNLKYDITSRQSQLIKPKPSDVPCKIEVPNPIDYHDFFEVRKLFTMQDLFDARVHYGHTSGTLNDHMKQFILGSRQGTLIFDLNQTAELLSDALNFIAHIAFRGGIILFVARYKQHTYLIEKTALECQEFCHTRHWHMGTFTDPKIFGMMTRLPDLTIFLNVLDSVFNMHRGVVDSNKLLIPSVAIVDSNCFPNYVTYPIPGNDDSPQSAELYCKLFKEAILRGKAKRKEFLEKYSNVSEESSANES